VAHVEVRPPTPAPAKASDDQGSIQRLLDSYVVAFQNKDRFTLRHIWPGMTDKNFKEMQGSFKDADSIHLTLRRDSPAQVSGNTGVVTCTQNADIKAGGQTQSFSQAATFHLKKLGDTDGEWVIDRIEYGKISH
jgi:hypothetical protein